MWNGDILAAVDNVSVGSRFGVVFSVSSVDGGFATTDDMRVLFTEDHASALANVSYDNQVYAGTGNFYDCAVQVQQNNTWTPSCLMATGNNRNNDFVGFNGTGRNCLYAAISGPNYQVVNGASAYVYRSTFCS